MLDRLPIGRAPLIMAVLFLLSAPFILAGGRDDAAGKKQLELWVFARTHREEYAARLPAFEAQHPGVKVRLQEIPGQVLVDKLLAAYLSETGAPDLVETEISATGRFFLGKPSDIGFTDLTERLKTEGWYEKTVESRFTPWSNKGRIYGVPHDIHPCVLLYRKDMLEPLGIDLPREVETWDDFVRVFTRPGVLDSDGDGRKDRYAVMLSRTGTTHLRMLMLQQGADLFDAQGEVAFDSPVAVRTLKWLQDAFFTHQFAFTQPPFGPDLYGPMKENRLFCVVAPDWFIGNIQKFAPELAGKYRAMPLPAWETGGRRTSTQGGTMMGLTKQSRHPELAWELLKFLYFDEAAVANRYRTTHILAPFKAAFSNPVFSEPDEFLGGQPLGQLFTRLADEVPPVRQDRYSTEALMALEQAVYQALDAPGRPVEPPLRAAADRVRQRIARDRFRNIGDTPAASRQ